MEKNKISQFKILCFEIYRKEKKLALGDAILLFDDYDVFKYLNQCYEHWKDLQITEIVTKIDEHICSYK